MALEIRVSDNIRLFDFVREFVHAFHAAVKFWLDRGIKALSQYVHRVDASRAPPAVFNSLIGLQKGGR